MKRVPIKHGYDQIVPIHNHSNGSANCVECGGHCKLQGAEVVLTGLVRWIFESERLTGSRMAYQVEAQLSKIGVNVDKFRREHTEAVSKIIGGAR